MLLPADVLILRSLGELSGAFPAVIFSLVVCSFKYEFPRHYSTICILAIGLYGFSTLYGILALMEFLAASQH